MSGIVPTAAGSTDPRMMDGITFDQGVIDTTVSTPPLVDQSMSSNRFSGVGAEVAESVMRDRLDNHDLRGMATPPNNQSLGKFGFEQD